MSSNFYAGVSIIGLSGSVTVIEASTGKIIYNEKNREVVPEKGDGNQVSGISKFVHAVLENCSLPETAVLNLTIAVERMFEYGQSFADELRDALSIVGKGKKTLPNISVCLLDAAAYLGCLKGVVIKADSGASVAGIGISAKSLSIRERGHLIGDPGSAYWIANKCLRMIYDSTDGIELVNFDLAPATKAVNEYFQLKKPVDILKPLYTEFSKTKMSLLSEKLATLAKQGDPFCLYLFKETGTKLGILLKAFLTQARKENEVMIQKGTLHLLGIGCVWNHYDLIGDGLFGVIGGSTFKDIVGGEFQQLKIYQWRSDDSHAVALLSCSGTTAADYLHLLCVEKLEHSK